MPAVSRLARAVIRILAVTGDTQAMLKLPSRLRQLTRTGLGMARAEPIDPAALQELASRERVVVIGVGMVRAGDPDPRLPGEQRTASLLTLGSVAADLPPTQAIVLHCG